MAIVAVLGGLAEAAPPVAIPTGAKDDLPHKQAELAPLLAHADHCFPASDDFDAVVDGFDGHVVVCAQAETRRGVSAFFDWVSYACWNADGVLTRRADLGRSFYNCADGACAGEPDGSISYDGRSYLAYDVAQHRVTITDRTSKARTHTFVLPAAVPAEKVLAWEFVYAGHTIFARAGERTFALDEQGHVLGSLAGATIDVADDRHVFLHSWDSTSGLWFVDGKPHKRTVARIYRSGPALVGGKAYAIDKRTLYTLDASTLAEKSSRALTICP